MRRHLSVATTVMVLVAGLVLGSRALAASGSGASDVAAAEAAAFGEADANGDGKLTPEEFASFETAMRQKLAALRFSRLDANGDGTLTQDEIAAGRPAGCGGFPPPPF